MKLSGVFSALSLARSLAGQLALLALVLGALFLAVVPWPSAIYVVLGICESSSEYIAGECSGNTFNWDWCVTDKFVRKMRKSDCTAEGGLIYFDEKQAEKAFRRLNPDYPVGSIPKGPG